MYNPTTEAILLQAEEMPVTGAYRTAATSKGARDGSVSKQWSERPDDQKFTSLSELESAVKHRAMQCQTVNLAPEDVHVTVKDGANIMLNIGGEHAAEMTHWSFGQLCSLTRCPAEYLRRLPAQMAAINLQHGLINYSGETMQAFSRHNGKHELRAMTGKGYGRIYDHEVVEQVRKIAGNGTGDTRWKVPGVIDWASNDNGTVMYNPFVNITKENTTLYASDRDVYIFLVDDTHPIEIGKLPNGEPDLMFRGFIVWNSETGSKSFGMSTMMLRGVCQNRNLWGVEGARELRIRHSSMAPHRFAEEAAGRLLEYSESSASAIIRKAQAAKALIVARDDEERVDFLTSKVKLSKTVTEKILETVMNEEQHPATSIWDMVQGITAHARKCTHQDARLDLENKAGKLMESVN